jgi:hypothetical protein
MKLFVLYIPGLDRRRVTSSEMPFTYDLLTGYPSARIRTLPSTELVPSLLTGTYPHQNRIFQISLKNEAGNSLLHKLLRIIPDSISVFLQCIYYMFDKKNELPTIPWNRRHYFNFHRLKYTRRKKNPEILNIIGGIPSLFHHLGEQSRYIFVKKFSEMLKMVSSLPFSDIDFEFLEFYAFDIFSHWNIDRSEAFSQALQSVDHVVKKLHENCEQKATSFVLLVDHGQERIKGTVNLKKLLKSSGVPRDEYLYFMEVSCTRLWFKTDRAREKILRLLEDLKHITVLDYRQIHQYNICFEDEKFGEVFIFPDHGYIFFPHDFYHPLANIFLALSGSEQRPRLFNPRHRGNHGYLPDHPAEEGYIVLADRTYESTSEIVDLIDFAPTVLALLEKPVPDYMCGQPIFIS